MPQTTLRFLAVGCLLHFPAAALSAQCPDGTPPPCGGRRVLTHAAVRVPSASDRARRFLVLPFRNVTRQSAQEWLVEGSTTMLSDALGRWQGITVVSDERLYPALKRAGIAPGSIIEIASIRRISEETGGWTAVTGEVIASGGRVRITARAWDVPSNRELMRTASEVPSGSDVRLAYDSVGLSLLRSTGLNVAAPDVAGVSNPNLDAYQAYLRGLAHIRRNEWQLALVDLQESVRADSTFASAWARLAEVQVHNEPADMYSPMSKGAQYAARAVTLSGNLPLRQRKHLFAHDALFRAQFGEAREALEGLIAADSSNLDAHEQLVGLELTDPTVMIVSGGQRPRGSPTRAARFAKRAAEMDPSRHALFGVLAWIYFQAGMPGSPGTRVVDRLPTSYPDLLQLQRQPEHVKRYAWVVKNDTIALVPAESLAFIPKDSLKAFRKQARAVARAWTERWILAAGDESSPYQMMSVLYALDGEFPAALRAVAKAESLGVQPTTWSAPAQRLAYLSMAGNLASASRLADSLTAASFFHNPTNIGMNPDATFWAFQLHLLAGRMAMASTVLEQQSIVETLGNPQNPAPMLSAFRKLMGNDDPNAAWRIPRAFHSRQLDSAIAHIMELAISDRIGPLVPILLPFLANAADSTTLRSGDVLKAANALAASGRTSLAYELASNMIERDSTAAVPASKFAWFRVSAEALNATRTARRARFHAATASVASDRATFEWTVDDAAPFAWNLPESPADQREYRWEIRLESPGRYFGFVGGAAHKATGAVPFTGTLAQLLSSNAYRVVFGGNLNANGVPTDTTVMQSVTLSTEIAPGVLRMIVTDRAVLDALRRMRPAEALFRFTPCAQTLGVVGKTPCVEQRVTISYP